MRKPIPYKRKLNTFNNNYEINTFVGVEETDEGWIAFTRHIEAGYFETKEDAEMVLLKIMLANEVYEDIEL